MVLPPISKKGFFLAGFFGVDGAPDPFFFLITFWDAVDRNGVFLPVPSVTSVDIVDLPAKDVGAVWDTTNWAAWLICSRNSDMCLISSGVLAESTLRLSAISSGVGPFNSFAVNTIRVETALSGYFFLTVASF